MKGPKKPDSTNRSVNKPKSNQASSEITPQADKVVQSHDVARDKSHKANETIQTPLPDEAAKSFVTACKKSLKTEAGLKFHQARCGVYLAKPASNQSGIVRGKSKEGVHEAEQEWRPHEN